MMGGHFLGWNQVSEFDSSSLSLDYNLFAGAWTQHTGKVFYPTALKGCRGIVFTHGVRMGGRAGGGK